MRKHRQQMTEAEIQAVESWVRRASVKAIAEHANARMVQKGVSGRELGLVLKHGRCIEVHIEAHEPRVLVRLDYGRPKVAVCAVLGLLTGTLVTTWKNAGDDAHKTLDLSPYTWRVNLVEFLGTLPQNS